MGRINPLRFKFTDQDDKVREYTFDGKMTIAEAMLLQEKGHCTPLSVFAAIDALEPRAVQTFVYLVKRRNGEAVKFEDLEKADIYSLEVLPVEDPDEAEGVSGEESKVDPPGRSGGKTRKAVTAPTD